MNASHPSVADLENSGDFELIDAIRHGDVHLWVKDHLYVRGGVTTAYWILNLLCVAVVAVVWHWARLQAIDAFSTLCLGMTLGFALLLPVHEYVHALAYRMVGASGVGVHYQLRRLTAYCVASDAVLNASRFVIVCLAPLVVLDPLLLAASLMVSKGKLALMLAGALLLHTGACSGDVAFVQYLWSRRRSRIFTFDDSRQPLTFFYRAKTLTG